MEEDRSSEAMEEGEDHCSSEETAKEGWAGVAEPDIGLETEVVAGDEDEDEDEDSFASGLNL